MDKRKKVAGFITFEFIMACLTSLLARLGLQMRNTASALYTQSLGYSKSAAGLTTTAYTIAALVFRPIVGKVIDRFGRMRTVIAGTVVAGAGLLALSFSKDLTLIYAMSVLCGIGFSFESTALSTVMTDLIPDEYLSEGLGYYSLTATVSQAVGPVIALAIIAGPGHTKAFLAGSALLAVSTLIALTVRYEKRGRAAAAAPGVPEESSAPEEKLPWWASLIEPKALKGCAIISFVTMGYASINTFMATYGYEIGLGETIGLFFTVNAIFTGIARLFTGQITRRIGNTNALRLSLILLMISFFGIPFAKGIVPLCVLSALQAMGNGLANITCNVLAILSTPKERRGSANATFYLLLDIGIGVGAALWGVVADMFGTVSVYWGSAILMTLIFIYTIFFMKSSTSETEN